MCSNEGKDCLGCLNASRSVVNLPPVDAMPEPMHDEWWESPAMWALSILAVAFLSGFVEANFPLR